MIVNGMMNQKERMVNMSIDYYDVQDRFIDGNSEPFEGVNYNGVAFQVVCVPTRNDNEEIVVQKVREFSSYSDEKTSRNPLVIVSCKDCNLEMKPLTTDWVVEVRGNDPLFETYYVTAASEKEAVDEAESLFYSDHPDCDDIDINDIYENY